jgi:hypothetical protein
MGKKKVPEKVPNFRNLPDIFALAFELYRGGLGLISR